MSLISLWKSNPSEIEQMDVQQLTAVAGKGVLRDGSTKSTELREYLASVSTELLGRYLTECLDSTFDNNGLVLQDIVNELGVRLDCKVQRGLYRGKVNEIGFDGIWSLPGGHDLVVEVKATDIYSINLDKLADYRNSLIRTTQITETSSILIVVGRMDTGALEAQVRGSRHAWDVRLIGADALLRLVKIKESADNKGTIDKIRSVLKPLELTKLDFVVELLATTTEDIQESSTPEVDGSEEGKQEKSFTPVAFNNEVAERVGKALNLDLHKRTRSLYISADNNISVRALASKEYVHTHHSGYWYAFHPYYNDALAEYKKSYVAFGCGSPKNILLFQLRDFSKLVGNMNTTEKGDRMYWHVHISKDDAGAYKLIFKSGIPSKDVTNSLIKEK